MEDISQLDHLYTSKSMIPQVDDELTFLWGRRIVQNFVNSYGIIGTLPNEYPNVVAYNLNLTKVFKNPPTAYFYFADGDKLQLWHYMPTTPAVPYIIAGDVLLVFHSIPNLGNSIYFRLVG